MAQKAQKTSILSLVVLLPQSAALQAGMTAVRRVAVGPVSFEDFWFTEKGHFYPLQKVADTTCAGCAEACRKDEWCSGFSTKADCSSSDATGKGYCGLTQWDPNLEEVGTQRGDWYPDVEGIWGFHSYVSKCPLCSGGGFVGQRITLDGSTNNTIACLAKEVGANSIGVCRGDRPRPADSWETRCLQVPPTPCEGELEFIECAALPTIESILISSPPTWPLPSPAPSAAPTSSPTAALQTAGPSAAPTESPTTPTTAPSAAPTLVIKYPTPAPTLASTAAKGDPHLTNIHRERFDLLQPGRYTLLRIPKAVKEKDSLLLVKADANQLGGSCSDLYFTALNVTGFWTAKAQSSSGALGLHYLAGAAQGQKDRKGRTGTDWQHFGSVDVKVVWGKTIHGVDYLNFFARHLAQVEYPIGGLLGEDDHTAASTPSSHCERSLSLALSHRGPRTGSVAAASLI